MSTKIVPRHKIVAFYGVPTESDGETTVTYHRMKKFTQFTHSKNPVEYSRQYVDEPFQRDDVVGFAPQYDYAFDKHTDLPVQNDIVAVTNGEKLADEAIRTIILVDMTTITTDSSSTATQRADAYMREYSVIPGSEGDNISIYTYSGSMKANGENRKVSVTSPNNEWQTVTVSS